MNSLLSLPWLAVAVRCALGVPFLIAGLIQLGEPRALAATLAGFRLLPLGGVSWAAASLPLCEIVLGLWLLLGWRRRAAAMAAVMLGGVLTAASAWAFAGGLSVSVQWFGLPVAGAAWLLPANGVLLGLAVFLMLVRTGDARAVRPAVSTPESVDPVLAGAMAVAKANAARRKGGVLAAK